MAKGQSWTTARLDWNLYLNQEKSIRLNQTASAHNRRFTSKSPPTHGPEFSTSAIRVTGDCGILARLGDKNLTNLSKKTTNITTASGHRHRWQNIETEGQITHRKPMWLRSMNKRFTQSPRNPIKPKPRTQTTSSYTSKHLRSERTKIGSIILSISSATTTDHVEIDSQKRWRFIFFRVYCAKRQ